MVNDVCIICIKPGKLSLVEKKEFKTNLIDKCKLENSQDILAKISTSSKKSSYKYS